MRILFMQDEVLVSREMLKAMGAETRIRILKALKERQKTQSELASELGLSAPTILEHIDQLQKAGLVERVPEDRERKWKYYRLTKTSENMVGRRRVSVVLMLAGTSFVIFGALAFLYLFTPVIMDSLLGGSALTAEPPPPSTGNIQAALTDLQSSSQVFLGTLIMVFFLISVFLAGAALGYSIKRKI